MNKKKNARYHTEGFTPEEMKAYYNEMLDFWASVGDRASVTYYTNKLQELEH